jgi:chromosome partitioning protein
MNAPIIAFFNPQGNVGTTSLVYHLAWMYQGLGLQVLALDLDPQASLTAMLVDEDRLAEIWERDNKPNTVAKCIQPLINGIGDVANPLLELIEDGFLLLSGDLSLSELEEDLSCAWLRCLNSQQKLPDLTTNPLDLVSVFWQLIRRITDTDRVDIVLLDLGANLGSINRSALLAADYTIVPLTLDIFSLQGLNHLQPTLNRWQREWQELMTKNSILASNLPVGKFQPLGYMIWQHSIRFDRSMPDSKSLLTQVANIYQDNFTLPSISIKPNWADDPNCLALLKNYQSLMPMALAARKAMFQLKPADGATGAYSQAVRDVSEDFRQLAQKIAQLTHIENWPNSANYPHNYQSIPEYKNPPSELPLYVLKQGSSLFRIHNRDYSALHFSRYQTRFASPIGEYGVLYAALDVYLAFLEVIRSVGHKIVLADSLKRMSLSELYPQRDLRLVNLSGSGLAKIGGDSRIVMGGYHLSQSWSQTLYEHPDRVDGIYYHSRHDNSRSCVVLYENRVLPSDLREQRVTEHNLLDRSFASDLQQILDNYGYQLDDDENLQG